MKNLVDRIVSCKKRISAFDADKYCKYCLSQNCQSYGLVVKKEFKKKFHDKNNFVNFYCVFMMCTQKPHYLWDFEICEIIL